MVETEELTSEFLPFVACFIPNHPTCYAMRFVKEEKIEKETELANCLQGEVSVLDATASVAITDSILLKRPVIHFDKESGPIEGILRFVVDGQIVAEEKVSDYLKGVRLEDGLFSWLYLDRQYWALRMDRPDQKETPKYPPVGLMATNAVRIQAFLRDIRISKKEKIKVGIVAALYSTKSGD